MKRNVSVSERTLILASGSPRRRELLKEAGFEFIVVTPDVDESVSPRTAPARACVSIARRKARAAARMLQKSDSAARSLIVAADTIVYLRGELLGKAADAAHARRILRKLSGGVHFVYTGVCCIAIPTGETRAFFVKTAVTMRPWSAREIENYIKSGEWKGKAGAYAIQESADRFVTKLDGSFTNVVGLPMERVGETLVKLNIRPRRK